MTFWRTSFTNRLTTFSLSILSFNVALADDTRVLLRDHKTGLEIHRIVKGKFLMFHECNTQTGQCKVIGEANRLLNTGDLHLVRSFFLERVAMVLEVINQAAKLDDTEDLLYAGELCMLGFASYQTKNAWNRLNLKRRALIASALTAVGLLMIREGVHVENKWSAVSAKRRTYETLTKTFDAQQPIAVDKDQIALAKLFLSEAMIRVRAMPEA